MAAGAKGTRTLWLLRHAKAVTDPPLGGSDFDRVLAPRGRRDAAALGHLFAGHGEGLGPALKGVPRPAVALVSPAARTVATAELVLADVAEPPERRLDHELYGADPEEVLAFLRALADDVDSAMVVGHNPTVHSLVTKAAGGPGQEGALVGGAARLPHLRPRRLHLPDRPVGGRGGRDGQAGRPDGAALRRELSPGRPRQTVRRVR